MRLVDRDRFSAPSVDWFLQLVGAAMLSAVATEAFARVDLVHAGKLFPYRHLPGIPLYGVPILVAEWAATALCALAIMAGVKLRVTVRVALCLALLGISQRYSNHRALLVIVLAFASLDPPEPRAEGFSEAPHPALALVRYQLVIVYVASAVNKLLHGFFSGDVLVTVLGFPRSLARPAAAVTVLLELALPLLLVVRPRIGVVGALLLHLAFALLLPATWSFGFLMLAMAVLFVVPPRDRTKR